MAQMMSCRSTASFRSPRPRRAAARFALGVLFAGLLAHAQREQRKEVLISIDQRMVNIHDLMTGTVRPFYQGRFYIPSVAVSEDGTHIAVQEKSGPGFTDPMRLVILDSSGRTVFTVEKDVRRFVWCCGSGKVAVITGPVRENDMGFEPEGAYFVDPATGTVEEIEGVRLPYDLHWADFDGAIYIRNAVRPESTQVFRYDWRTATLTRTAHKGIFFSPDGKYYFDSYNTQLYGLYRTEDDSALTHMLSAELRRWGAPWWLPGSAHRLVLTEAKYLLPSKRHLQQSHVVDPESGEVVQSFRGDVRGLLGRRWATNARAIVIRQEAGGLKLMRLAPP